MKCSHLPCISKCIAISLTLPACRGPSPSSAGLCERGEVPGSSNYRSHGRCSAFDSMQVMVLYLRYINIISLPQTTSLIRAASAVRTVRTSGFPSFRSSKPQSSKIKPLESYGDAWADRVRGHQSQSRSFNSSSPLRTVVNWRGLPIGPWVAQLPHLNPSFGGKNRYIG